MSDNYQKVNYVTESKPSLFFGLREYKFFNDISQELIEVVVKQKLRYYAAEEKLMNAHWLYGETKNKVYRDPVELYARIMYQEPQFTTGQFGSDRKYQIDVYFQREVLQRDLGMNARVGDFVEWDNKFFEILSVIEPQIVDGLPEFKMAVIANCESVRLGVFNPKRSMGDIGYDNKNEIYR